MKYIKDKCKYCDTHDFYYSYYSCYIGGSFKKDNNDVSCVIDNEIDKIEQKLEEMKKYKEFINKSQNKIMQASNCNVFKSKKVN